MLNRLTLKFELSFYKITPVNRRNHLLMALLVPLRRFLWFLGLDRSSSCPLRRKSAFYLKTFVGHSSCFSWKAPDCSAMPQESKRVCKSFKQKAIGQHLCPLLLVVMVFLAGVGQIRLCLSERRLTAGPGCSCRHLKEIEFGHFLFVSRLLSVSIMIIIM